MFSATNWEDAHELFASKQNNIKDLENDAVSFSIKVK